MMTTMGVSIASSHRPATAGLMSLRIYKPVPFCLMRPPPLHRCQQGYGRRVSNDTYLQVMSLFRPRKSRGSVNLSMYTAVITLFLLWAPPWYCLKVFCESQRSPLVIAQTLTGPSGKSSSGSAEAVVVPLSVVAPLIRKRFWFESIWRVSDPLRFKEARTAVGGVSETGGVAGTDGVTETDGVGGIEGAGGMVGSGATARVGGVEVGSIALSV